MSPRTQTRPVDDPKMWRRLVARTHPDAGGDHELFIWTGMVKDVVCGGDLRVGPKPRAPEPQPTPQPPPSSPSSPPDDKPRVPYPDGTDFEECTRTALLMGATDRPYGRVLSLLADCRPLDDLAHEQNRGASYKRLAAIGHKWGMSKRERVGWYRVADEIPLSDRHASHILGKLRKRAA